MQSAEKTIILRVVETYIRTGVAGDDKVKVTGLPAGKTSYVEENGDGGRSIILDEYRLDGLTVWAGYSLRSGTVYLSPARS